MKTGYEIKPAEGKLGILIPGMGAVATTVMAGVYAVRKNLGKPIGSLTQMGTIRLGKRTDHRSPKIKEFVPLYDLENIEFGGWDIFADNAYEAAVHAAVLEPGLLEKIKPELESIRPMPAVFSQHYVKRLNGTHVKQRQEQDGAGRAGARGHPQFQENAQADAAHDGVVRQHGDLHRARRRAPVARSLRKGAGGG